MQWRKVADQLRPKLPKLAGFLDEAETDVLAYMTFPLDQSDRTPERRDQAPNRGGRHLPQ